MVCLGFLWDLAGGINYIYPSFLEAKVSQTSFVIAFGRTKHALLLQTPKYFIVSVGEKSYSSIWFVCVFHI